jgi:hypothetical protein
MPLRSQLHIDKLLSNVSQKYKSGEHIHAEVFPMLPVKNDTDKIRVHVRNIRLQETARDDKALSRESSHEYSTSSYSLALHSLKDYISQSEQDNNDLGNLLADTVEELSDKISLRKEVDCAALFTSGSWSQNTSLTAAQAWNLDTVTSNPIPFMDTAASTVLKQSGYAANYAIIPHSSMLNIKNHLSILDRVKYTSSEITKDIIGSLFGVGEILVASAQYDTTAEGIAESLTNIWPNYAFVGYKALRPGLRQASAGYQVTKTGMEGMFVRRWVDEERMDAQAVEVNAKYQFKIVSSLSGYLIKDLD